MNTNTSKRAIAVQRRQQTGALEKTTRPSQQNGYGIDDTLIMLSGHVSLIMYQLNRAASSASRRRYDLVLRDIDKSLADIEAVHRGLNMVADALENSEGN